MSTNPHVPLTDRTAQQVEMVVAEAREAGLPVSRREVLQLAVQLGLAKVLPHLRALREQASADACGG
jgi:hypothetical protein